MTEETENTEETEQVRYHKKSKFKQNLENLFNMEPEPLKPVRPYVRQAEKDAAESAEYARIKLKKFIEIGEEMLDEAEAMAKSTGDPKAIQAFNNLLKTLGEMSSNVLRNDGEKVRIDKIHHEMDKPAKGQPQTVNNTVVFTGTAADLLKRQKERAQEGLVIEQEPKSE